MQQIAVRHMHLDGVEACTHRAARCCRERLAHPLDVIERHRARCRPVGAERNGRWRHRRPGIGRGGAELPALPRHAGGTLAASMRKLHGDLGAADTMAMRDDALERSLAGVGIKPEAAVADAAVALDIGHLGHYEACARIGEHAEVGQVPVRSHAIVGAVLAHG